MFRVGHDSSTILGIGFRVAAKVMSCHLPNVSGAVVLGRASLFAGEFANRCRGVLEL